MLKRGHHREGCFQTVAVLSVTHSNLTCLNEALNLLVENKRGSWGSQRASYFFLLDLFLRNSSGVVGVCEHLWQCNGHDRSG